jgi:crossover junction endodeoxyribonuclease RuvC
LKILQVKFDIFAKILYNSKDMIIVGFDPGIATLGYGVIKTEKRGKPEMVDYGIVSTPKDKNIAERLAMLEKGIKQIIDKFKPDEIAVEELFFAKNVKTGIAVAHARGVILLTAIKECGKIFEYTPLQIKQALTGYGRAEKNQIQQMVKTMLSLKSIPRPDDAADALAVALCHAQTNKLGGLFSI